MRAGATEVVSLGERQSMLAPEENKVKNFILFGDNGL